jgi:spermidine dehydrogenase
LRARPSTRPAVATGESYDLVVVGGGISGLAAAWFYKRANHGARILILDNHDDFGGHAKRNEFVSANGRVVLGHGGSQSLQTPSYFSPAVADVVRSVGIDLERFETEFYDRDWRSRHALGQGVFFARETFGTDRLVRESGRALDWVPSTPLPEAA